MYEQTMPLVSCRQSQILFCYRTVFEAEMNVILTAAKATATCMLYSYSLLSGLNLTNGFGSYHTKNIAVSDAQLIV